MNNFLLDINESQWFKRAILHIQKQNTGTFQLTPSAWFKLNAYIISFLAIDGVRIAFDFFKSLLKTIAVLG